MKILAGSMLMLVLALFAASGNAKTPPSSFVPRGSQHAAVNNKNSSKLGGPYRGGRASVQKSAGKNPRPHH